MRIKVLALVVAVAIVILGFWAWQHFLQRQISDEWFLKQERRTISSPFDHSLFDALLQKYVNEAGLVNYKGLRAKRVKLDKYLETLARATPFAFTKDEEQKAFWINAYNACTITGVLNHLPAKESDWGGFSVRKVSGFWTQDKYHIAGVQITLDEMEKKLLLARYKDPRIHFAIVCASKSCPILENHAFSGENLEMSLIRAAKRFLNDPARIKIDLLGKKMRINPIFKWYESDFEQQAHSVQKFIAGYVEDKKTQNALNKESFSIEYGEYDWGLNLQHN